RRHTISKRDWSSDVCSSDLCRVSTDSEEQINSYKNQLAYYTEKIGGNPAWKMAGIYADEGITGTSMKHREDFKRMLRACREGRKIGRASCREGVKGGGVG